MRNNKKLIKELTSRVNKTLNYYEKDYTSAKRTPEIDKELCTSFENYVEIRFNFEACRIPEIKKAVELTEGHLFFCEELEHADTAKRKFKKAHIKIITEDMIEVSDQTLKDEITKVKNFIGGSHIIFNSVREKIKLVIQDD